MLAGFFTWFVVMNDYGYPPGVLPSTGRFWQDEAIMCRFDGNNYLDRCGFGCEATEEVCWGPCNNEDTELGCEDIGDGNKCQLEYVPCDDSCPIPFPGFADPFYEHTEMGFRGYAREFFETDGLLQALNNAASGLAKANRDLDSADDWAAYSTCGRTCEWYYAINTADYPDSNQTVAEKLLSINEEMGDMPREALDEADPNYFARFIYT